MDTMVDVIEIVEMVIVLDASMTAIKNDVIETTITVVMVR